MHGDSEKVLMRYFSRDLIPGGKARLHLDAAKKLVHLDCAHSLYAVPDVKDYEREEEIGRDLS